MVCGSGRGRLPLRQVASALQIGQNGVADHFNGMREEIAPDVFVEVLAGGIFSGRAARRHGTVRALGIAFDIELRGESAGVAVGRSTGIDVDDRAVAM